jgi:hypothetical protein
MSLFNNNAAQAQGVGYFGALVTSISAWGIDNIFSVLGLLMGLATFLAGQHYSRKREKREQVLFELELRIREAELTGFRRRKDRKTETEITQEQ